MPAPNPRLSAGRFLQGTLVFPNNAFQLNAGPAAAFAPPRGSLIAAARREGGFLTGGLRRERRVLYLLAAVVLMSLADLAITIEWVTQVGLAESNPLARWVIEQGSVGLLSFWKLATVVPAVTVFASLRAKAIAEAGAVVAFLVLCAVTAHWYGYHADTAELTHALPAFEQGVDKRWTVLAAGPSLADTLHP